MEEILLMVAEPETETITYNQGKAKHAKSPAIFPKEHIMCDIADTDKICVTCEHELHQIIEYTIKKLDLISTQIKVIGNFHLKYTYKTYKKMVRQTLLNKCL
jgi:transposase